MVTCREFMTWAKVGERAECLGLSSCHAMEVVERTCSTTHSCWNVLLGLQQWVPRIPYLLFCIFAESATVLTVDQKRDIIS